MNKEIEGKKVEEMKRKLIRLEGSVLLHGLSIRESHSLFLCNLSSSFKLNVLYFL